MADFKFQKYTDEEKHNFITSMTEDLLAKADPYEIALYQQFVEEGCGRDDVASLEAKGYGSYSGNAAYPQDYAVAKECMERLLALTDDGYYANTLGYIYYYGRTNDGEPQYDQALIYFSLGAAQGVYESTYKLADMFLYGRGVPKSGSAAANLVSRLYAQTKDVFCHEEFRGKFADVALRMGYLLEKGIGVKADPVCAYSAYMQAELAIQLRMKSTRIPFDEGISKKIHRHLVNMHQALKEKNFFVDYVVMPGPIPIRQFLDAMHTIEVEFTANIDGSYMMRFGRLTPDHKDTESYGDDSGDDPETGRAKELVTIAEFSSCVLTDSLTIRVDDVDYIDFPNGMYFYCDSVEYDEKSEHFYLSLGYETQAEIKANRWVIYKKDLPSAAGDDKEDD